MLIERQQQLMNVWFFKNRVFSMLFVLMVTPLFLFGFPVASHASEGEEGLSGTMESATTRAKPGGYVRFIIKMHNNGSGYIYHSQARLARNKYYKTPKGGTDFEDEIWIPPGGDQLIIDNETIADNAPNGAQAILIVTIGADKQYQQKLVHKVTVFGSKIKGLPAKDVPALFKFVFGRLPTTSEKVYWVNRLADKPTKNDVLGAMAFQKSKGSTGVGKITK